MILLVKFLMNPCPWYCWCYLRVELNLLRIKRLCNFIPVLFFSYLSPYAFLFTLYHSSSNFAYYCFAVSLCIQVIQDIQLQLLYPSSFGFFFSVVPHKHFCFSHSLPGKYTFMHLSTTIYIFFLSPLMFVVNPRSSPTSFLLTSSSRTPVSWCGLAVPGAADWVIDKWGGALRGRFVSGLASSRPLCPP